MVFFIAIVIHDFGKVFFKVFKYYIIEDHITFNNKSIRAGVFLFAFLLLKPFLKLFLNLFKRFHIARRIIYRLKILEFFGFFNSKVFHNSTLSLYLSHSNISKMIALLGLLVYIPNI